VVPDRELRRFPAGVGVTSGALTAISSGELALMTVLMAVEAPRVRNRGTEVRRAMALCAFHRPVFAI
jgi:hypothetical protein